MAVPGGKPAVHGFDRVPSRPFWVRIRDTYVLNVHPECAASSRAPVLPRSRREADDGSLVNGATVGLVPPDSVSAMQELDRARYITLTTFKRDGSAVSTPVWVTGSGGTYLFTTGGNSWKARRLQRNSSVQVRACDMRGRVKPAARQFVGTGVVDGSAEALTAAERALSAKYGWQFKVTRIGEHLKTRFGRGAPEVLVAVKLSLREG